MIKLRIQGEEEEVDEFIKFLEAIEPFYKILSVSDGYKNRNSVYIRRYIEIKKD